MSRSQINLQDAFLNHVRKEKVPVVINLSGGGKIEGLVKGFDNFVILLKHEGQHLIYKHAINTIIPERPVELAGTPHPREEADVKSPGAEETTAPAPEEPGEPWVEG
jgi:host factor-I protein